MRVLLAILFVWACSVQAADCQREATRYQRELARNARLVWGLDAPVATFAAQIETESRWCVDALSPVGASGMAQFMPSTAAWLAQAYPSIGAPQLQNPAWAMRALVQYDRALWVRVTAHDNCERMAFALASYNAGPGIVDRKRTADRAAGGTGLVWFGGADRWRTGQSAANYHQTSLYVVRILREREPVYIGAGWGTGACESK